MAALLAVGCGLVRAFVVLMVVKNLNAREMEAYVSENVVRVCSLGDRHLQAQIRDHSNIARAYAALARRGRGGQCADPPYRPDLALPLSVSSRPIQQRRSCLLGIPTNRGSCGVCAALWPCPAQLKTHACGRRRRPHAGPNDPQIGQRTPPVCPGKQEKRQVLTRLLTEVGQLMVQTRLLVKRLGERLACDPQRHHHTHDDARSGQATRAADRALDHHWGGGARHISPCGCPKHAPLSATRLQARGVWLAVSAQSSWRRGSLWDRDPREPRRVEEALTSARGVPRHLWAQATPALVVYDRGGYATTTLRR